MSAPCSVKAYGSVGENLSFLRWSQFATTSDRSAAVAVAAHLLVEPLGGHAVERGEIGVDHDLVAAHDGDMPGDLDGGGREKGAVLGHGRRGRMGRDAFRNELLDSGTIRPRWLMA